MVKCCGMVSCRKLQCSDFDLTHEDPSLFVKSQISQDLEDIVFECNQLENWLARRRVILCLLPIRWSRLASVVWNTFWLVYFTIILFLDILFYTVEYRNQWIIALTNWAFLLVICTTLVESVSRMYFIKCSGDSDKESSQEMIWIQKIQWVLHNTNNVVVVSMTIVYFSVYEIDTNLRTVSKHVLTTCYVLLNTLVMSSIPVKLFHFYQPVVFFIFYAIFVSIYQQAASHNGIFLELDWNNPKNTAIILSCLVLVGPLVLHLLFYCAFRIRSHLFKKCSKYDSSLPLTSTLQRGTTTTDVILEESESPEIIDIKPEVKDDIAVKSSASANGDAFKHNNGRLYRSETDLRDYRLKNGLFCEFAKSSLILHSSTKSTNDIFDDDIDNVSCRTKTRERRGSQIIVVKKCPSCANEEEDDEEEEENERTDSNCDSSASSDYLSQYITEDILAYL